MPPTRFMPTPEADDLIALVRDIASKGLAPVVASTERAEKFPREIFGTLGRAGAAAAV